MSATVKTRTRTVQRSSHEHVRRRATDVCVVGSGAAGISAALESARLGKRVVLVDALPALGGQIVNSVIGTIVGLFSNDDRQLTHGIADDILRDLGSQGAIAYQRTHTMIVLYDEVALARWIERAVRDEEIIPLLGATMRHVHREGERVAALEFVTRYGDVTIEAEGFVDATGDAALCWQAGQPCREPAEGPIYGSQMIVVEKVRATDGFPGKQELSAKLAAKAESYGLVRRAGLAFAFPGRGTALVNMTHIETPLDPFAASLSGIDGKQQADRALEFLREEYPAIFGDATVRAYGLPGIRQTRWIVGRKQLVVDEVRAGTRFPDSIARTAWPIELHDSAEGVTWEPFGREHLHYVPYRSLTPSELENVLAVGRCIDADSAALSSVRVIGPCIAMGAAAAHALDLAGAGSAHAVDIRALRKRLRANLEG